MQKKQDLEDAEQARIHTARELNRQGSRLKEKETLKNSYKAGERLYQESTQRDERARDCMIKVEAEEMRKVNSTRSLRPTLTPRRRAASESRVGANGNETVGDRLHKIAAEQQARKQYMKTDAIAKQLSTLDTVGRGARQKNLHHDPESMHRRHKEKEEKMMELRWQQQKQEIGMSKQPKPAGQDEIRNRDEHYGRLHQDARRGHDKIEQERSKRELREMQLEKNGKEQREKDKVARRQYYDSMQKKKEASNVGGNGAGLKDFGASAQPTALTPKLDPYIYKAETHGFLSTSPRFEGGIGGSTTPRGKSPRPGATADSDHVSPGDGQGSDRTDSRITRETLHHVLHVCESALDLRTGQQVRNEMKSVRDEVDRGRTATETELTHVMDYRKLEGNLEQVLTMYREAQRESETNGEGFVYLRQMGSLRLWADVLRPESEGRHECKEPDPIKQLKTGLDELMEQADHAQDALLAQIGPQNTHDLRTHDIRKSWPKGKQWAYPKCCKAARFAFNPGVKSREDAETKAFVRYAPAERTNCYRHLLDLARASLIFTDAKALRQGLEEIKEQFEVVSIRNYYHPSLQNMLGHRYIEVNVVLSENLEAPHVCEIRLIEMCYWTHERQIMKQEPEGSYIEKMSRILAEMYFMSDNLTDRKALEYLVKWTLNKPRDVHALTVFRRHLKRHYGSAVAAWRLALKDAPLVPFIEFRRVCQQLKQRENTTEFWQGMDSCYAGCISLFELDPDAVVLLARFYQTIGVQTDGLHDGDLFKKLKESYAMNKHKRMAPGVEEKTRAKKTEVEVNPHALRMEEPEFKQLVKPWGFTGMEAAHLFNYLDRGGGRQQEVGRHLGAHTGDCNVGQASITKSDLDWLKKIPQLIHIPAVMVRPKDGVTHDGELNQALLQISSGRRHNRAHTARLSKAVMQSGYKINDQRPAQEQDLTNHWMGDQPDTEEDYDEEEEEEDEEDVFDEGEEESASLRLRSSDDLDNRRADLDIRLGNLHAADISNFAGQDGHVRQDMQTAGIDNAFLDDRHESFGSSMGSGPLQQQKARSQRPQSSQAGTQRLGVAPGALQQRSSFQMAKEKFEQPSPRQSSQTQEREWPSSSRDDGSAQPPTHFATTDQDGAKTIQF